MCQVADYIRHSRFGRWLFAKADRKAYHAKASIIYSFWIIHGFTLEQAAGLLAQSDAESTFDEKAVGDDGTAFGIHQHHLYRIDKIKSGCGINLAQLPPLIDQLQAAWWELQNVEYESLLRIKATKTSYDAGFAAAKYWERPRSPEQWHIRGQRAEVWRAYFNQFSTPGHDDPEDIGRVA